MKWPERDDDAADEHAAVLAEQAIGDEAAEDRRAPDAARVGAVDRRRVRVREAQPAGAGRRDHVEDQERAHPVVAEALPHLGEEERGEAARDGRRKRDRVTSELRRPASRHGMAREAISNAMLVHRHSMSSALS